MANKDHEVFNPWYVLMTIAGEPENERDEKTTAKNRRYWNGWACSDIEDEDERAALAEKVDLDAKDLEPLSAKERAEIAAVFRERLGTPPDEDGPGLARVTSAFQSLDQSDSVMPNISADIDLSHLEFEKPLLLKKWIFPRDFRCEETVFNERVSFELSIFRGEVWFRGSKFRKTASFKSVLFERTLWFDLAQFQATKNYFSEACFSESWFVQSKISGGDFSSAIFLDYVDFRRSKLSERTSFSNAKFNGNSIFQGCHFADSIGFLSATFSAHSDFRFSKFRGHSTFRTSTFIGPAWFGSTTWEVDADFASSTFEDSIHFDSVVFSEDANFTSAKFSGYSKFVGTHFKNDAIFREAQFEKPASFRDSPFGKMWPDLTGAILDPRTEFSAQETVELMDEESIRTADGITRHPKGRERTQEAGARVVSAVAWPNDPTDLQAARDSAAIIRHTIAQQGRPEDEHFFFRKEMGFRARIGGWWARLPYRLFRMVSDFGNSICRPIVGLALTFAVFWPVISSFLKSHGLDVVQAIWTGFGISFANTFPFFGFGRTMHPEFFSEAPAWLDLIAGAQSVLGFVFLFFLGLGLRTRFRLR